MYHCITNFQMLPAARTASPLTVKPDMQSNGVIKTQLTEKDVSRLWANDDLKYKKLVTPKPEVCHSRLFINQQTRPFRDIF